MSDKELELTSDQLLIIKTDLTGKFTYCNQQFIQLTGYQEQDILNQPLSKIYHGDMPHGIEHLLWQTLKTKREFNFFLKIKTQSADTYWTFANITSFRNSLGKVAGYTCSLRAPNPAATMMFSMYYEQMRDEEKGQNTDNSAKQSLDLLIDLVSATGDDYEASVFKLQFS